MAVLAEIYDWFMTGKKPTQAQFWASWGSFWNKSESIPQSAVSNLTTVLAAKTENDQFNAHKTANDAHQDLFDLKEDKSNKGEVNGYVPLNEFALIASQYLQIVDDFVTGGSASIASAETVKTLKTQIDAINLLLTSDDVNLDTVQELVNAIKEVETWLETILVNDLTTGGTTKALTAEMGKFLKEYADGKISGNTNSLVRFTSTSTIGDSRIIDDGICLGFGGAPGNYDPPSDIEHLFQFINNGTTKQVLAVTSVGATTFSNNMHWYRYRGTLSVPTATVANDYFMSMGFRGHDGANITQSAGAFQALTPENWTATSTPVRFVFQTTDSGKTAVDRKTALEIRENQDVYVASNFLQYNSLKPSWHSNYKVINTAKTSGIRSHTASNEIMMYNNMYFDTDWRYTSNGFGSFFHLNDIGDFVFSSAVSGITGNIASVVDLVKIRQNGDVDFSGAINLKSYTVGTLPTGRQGDTAYVTDATAPTYLGTLTGGGSVKCPVFYNGTAWVSH